MASASVLKLVSGYMLIHLLGLEEFSSGSYLLLVRAVPTWFLSLGLLPTMVENTF